VYQPDAREKRLWEASKQQSAAMQDGGAVYDAPALRAYVQSVLDRLLGTYKSAYLPLEPIIVLVDSPEVNAFALPHGDIYIHTGILGRIRNEAQLAMLLGHELAHSMHRHAYQRFEHTYDSTAVYSYVAVLSALGGSNVQSAMEGLSRMIVLAAISGYGRDKESEADQVGLTLLAQAGYDARQGAAMFEQMKEAADRHATGWNFFYSTHPRMASRVRSAERLVRNMAPELLGQARDLGQDRYLEAASGQIYAEVSRHIAQGKYALAEWTVEFLKGARPSDAKAFALAGNLYRARAEEDDHHQALQSYSQAIALDGNCAAAHKGLGYALARVGDNVSASEHLQIFLQLSPSAPDAPYVTQFIERLTAGGANAP
jgi:predicted Zn-dependent protease